MIQIDHVTFSYGEETEHTGGVRDIELQIKRGEFAVLCGESGCGKTTLLRILAGLEGLDRGEILFEKQEKLGVVFQEPRVGQRG